jgi:hypothetical protein
LYLCRSVKHLTVISLLALLLYNAFGYQLLYLYEWERLRLDSLESIPESAMQVVKLNVSVYTPASDTEFEYVDKEMTIESKVYHIVKQRVKNDSLHLYYIRNVRREELQASVHQMLRSQLCADAPSPEAPVKNLIQSFLKDYVLHDRIFAEITFGGMAFIPALPYPEPTDRRYKIFLSVFSPPPELA